MEALHQPIVVKYWLHNIYAVLATEHLTQLCLDMFYLDVVFEIILWFIDVEMHQISGLKYFVERPFMSVLLNGVL